MSLGTLLITGAAGMLGQRAAADAAAAGWTVVGTDLGGAEVELDLTDAQATASTVASIMPSAVIHCAAFVDVDGAEEREGVAFAVNGDASGNLARACQMIGARLVAVSTDYVFDGELRGRPYLESDPTAPLGAYGRTKLAGEQAIASETGDYVIARTAWLFGWPGKSFPDTMLRAGAARGEVAVVTDQVGSPTWTGHLSQALVSLASGSITGVVHTAGGGQCSWHELTVELYRQAGLDVIVNETDSTAFVRPAPRPAWSVLATERAEEGAPVLPDWREGVAGYLAERGDQA
ncbi:MAG: dTDP-4-dehydrorhamnose reductase [Solirubrobacteraceae bacterium]|nr:dTDP-4-dehydrorhamnose reductase [Solirubrobacteraceae bacterium]